MSRSDAERVADILEAAEELDMVVALGREGFAESVLLRRAAERLLEIIGEASTELSDEYKAAHPGVAWRDVGAPRILLAHHYHRIDLDQVWQIASISEGRFKGWGPSGGNLDRSHLVEISACVSFSFPCDICSTTKPWLTRQSHLPQLRPSFLRQHPRRRAVRHR